MEPLLVGAVVEKRKAWLHPEALPRATYICRDDHTTGVMRDGGARAFFTYPDRTDRKLREAGGRMCSSYRAEMVALQAATQYLLEHPATLKTRSSSARTQRRQWPHCATAQFSPLDTANREHLVVLARGGSRPIHLPWVPAHCDLEGNERADAKAKEAAALP